MNIFGKKHSKSTDYGSKLKNIVKKGAKIYGGGLAVMGVIGAVSGFDKPGAKMVRSRGGLERAIRG